jgi:ketosteroid isomerase-like protein
MAPPAVDARYAARELVSHLRDYFARKSAGDLDGFTRLFHRDAVYADATLGWCVRGRETISARFGELMPRWVETGARLVRSPIPLASLVTPPAAWPS